MSIITHKKNWISNDYHIHIDTITNTLIKGWLVNKSELDYKLFIMTDKQKIEINNNIFRPNLTKSFPNIENACNSGFEINIEKIKNDFTLTVSVDNNNTPIISKSNTIDTKILYVHIAKTAGSTVNNFIKKILTEERVLTHVESNTNWLNEIENDNISFISGHLPYIKFISCPKIKDEFKKAITFREPYSHVISHLSWVRALSLPENKERFDNHPEYIQTLSLKLKEFDLSKPCEIKNMINGLEGPEISLFDNTQTRYIRTNISKNKVDEKDVQDSFKNLIEFDYIGNDKSIDDFLSKIGNAYNSEIKNNSKKSNVLNEKFGLDIKNKEIRNALYPLVKYDLEIYKFIINK